MNRSLRAIALFALLFTAFVACVEIDHATQLNADGSGKFMLTMSAKSEMIEALPGTEDPFAEFNDPPLLPDQQ